MGNEINSIGREFNKAGRAMGYEFNKVGHEMNKAAKAVDHEFNKAGKEIEKGYKKVEHEVNKVHVGINDDGFKFDVDGHNITKFAVGDEGLTAGVAGHDANVQVKFDPKFKINGDGLEMGIDAGGTVKVDDEPVASAHVCAFQSNQTSKYM